MGDPHPQFSAFLALALRDPKVRRAYRRAQVRWWLRRLVCRA